MKKSIFILAIFAVLIGLSCREEKTEKIIIEKQVEVPVETPKAKEKESDGTTLSIDNDGVEFSTKKGDTKTEVEIK
jgi:hypothetical protein